MSNKSTLPNNVYLLTIAQALVGSVGAMVVFIGGLIGSEIAPDKQYATLPIAMIIIGTALFTIPVTLLMKRIGRKSTFLFVLILSVFVALIAAYTIYLQAFYWFCFVIMFFGMTTASALQYRFAAMESVTQDMIPKAISTVLLGGLLAAFLGPELGLMGKHLFTVPYVGSFVFLSGLFILGFIVLLNFKNPKIITSHTDKKQRSLTSIVRQPVFIVALSSAAVGYAIMSFVMTATPISMHKIDGHAIGLTKNVIQSHIVAMYLPSLFTAWIIRKIGIMNMLIVGLILYVACVTTAYFSQSLTSYWIALVLLGLGWNFLFIGGTSLLAKAYHPSERFKVQAMNDFIIFGSQAIAALSAGSIIFHLGWQSLILLVIPFILVQLIIILRWKSLLS